MVEEDGSTGEHHESGDDAGTSLPFPRASVEDFAVTDLTAVFSDLPHADDFTLEQVLRRAVADAAAKGDEPAERAYCLLATLCSFHLRVDEAAAAWAPRWQSQKGRSFTASDIPRAQIMVLADVVATITHPALRARVADVVWYSDRAQTEAAFTALNSYCELVEGHLAGTFTLRYAETGIIQIVSWLHRAAQIHAMSRRRQETPDALRGAFDAVRARARETSQYVAYEKVAHIGLEFGLIDWPAVASEAEALAQERAGGDYPLALQKLWDLAAQAHKKLGDNEAMRRCQERFVDETLRMRERVSTASARAYWTRMAIGQLRNAGNFKERVDTLRTELRALQDAALDEVGQYSIPMDLTTEQAGTVKVFGRLSLPDALEYFAMLARPPRLEDLRRMALETRKEGLARSMFGSSYADREGKTIAEFPAAAHGEDPDAAWVKEQSLSFLDIRRHQIVGAAIEPARRVIVPRFPLEERHFAPIAEMSPFVPPGHEHLFALGFARFWQGDFASAAHLLIPQLENSLRYVLLNANRESSKIKPDLLQEDRSLSGLLQSLRSELEDVFGADLIYELELLFTFKPGPALRHEMAHGKTTAADCYHANAIYACWLIYRLTCIPLLETWGSEVAPAIEQESF